MTNYKSVIWRGAISYVITLALFAAIVGTVEGAEKYTPQQETLLNALIQVESSGNDKAIGDNGNAIGCLQIWKVYWIDATERSGIGGSYKDCFNRDYAKRIVDAYMKRYAREAWTNPAKFDAEKCARIHNGGPRGHTKKATDKYWNKVRRLLQ
jgi:hypothetical protein